MLEAEDLAEKTVLEERLPVSESSADSSLDFVTGSSSSSPVLFSFADGLSNLLTTRRGGLLNPVFAAKCFRFLSIVELIKCEVFSFVPRHTVFIIPVFFNA